MERLAITTKQQDIAAHVALAREHSIGIEIQVYGCCPQLLNGDLRNLVSRHKALLAGFDGEIALHGAFYDMVSASKDVRVVALTRERYLSNLRIAAELGARHVIFHANFCPLIRHPGHRMDWTERQVVFWEEMAEEASALDLVIALENMWEPEPGIIADVLDRVDSPHMGACLDVGHVYLYSNSLPISRWLDRVGGRLVHCHINNNPGTHDQHLPLDSEAGVIDYGSIIPMLQALSPSPLVALEMESLADLERSLCYLGR